MKTQTKLPLKPVFIHLNKKKIPILQYLKAGYEKLLPLYLKDIPRR